MPLYDYHCSDCEKTTEIFSTRFLKDDEEVECPKCTSKNFKRVWEGVPQKEGQETFSVTPRNWRKGLSVSEQSSCLLGDRSPR